MKSIIEYAFALTEAVSRLMERVRAFFYQVMLSGHLCPSCHGQLEMIGEGRARCLRCNRMWDPTISFQRPATEMWGTLC